MNAVRSVKRAGHAAKDFGHPSQGGGMGRSGIRRAVGSLGFRPQAALVEKPRSGEPGLASGIQPVGTALRSSSVPPVLSVVKEQRRESPQRTQGAQREARSQFGGVGNSTRRDGPSVFLCALCALCGERKKRRITTEDTESTEGRKKRKARVVLIINPDAWA